MEYSNAFKIKWSFGEMADIEGIDIVERNAIFEVVRDAQMFAILVKRGDSVGEEMAAKMRGHYSDVSLPTRDVPSAAMYSNLLVTAQLGAEIDKSNYDLIDTFREETERYMTKPPRR